MDVNERDDSVQAKTDFEEDSDLTSLNSRASAMFEVSRFIPLPLPSFSQASPLSLIVLSSRRFQIEKSPDPSLRHSLDVSENNTNKRDHSQSPIPDVTRLDSQRIVAGTLADSLWRLEKMSGDDSYRMRERDEVSN